ncbi:hypothetical protein H0H93_011309 [Arthromyces matolae]|nr:hypothetical protein H0H93_011309 [Arthromyces matolae]
MANFALVAETISKSHVLLEVLSISPPSRKISCRLTRGPRMHLENSYILNASCTPRLCYRLTNGFPDFIQNGNLDEWRCNVCTPTGKPMTLKMAERHERLSTEHARKVIDLEQKQWMSNEPDAHVWDAPLKREPLLTKSEMKIRDSQMHVELTTDMVKFWIRGMEAAEKGEVLHLEEFLGTLEVGDVESHDDQAAQEKKRGRRRLRPRQKKAGYRFVENFARQEAADEEKKRRMHDFFEMPTDEKLEKIRALIH